MSEEKWRAHPTRQATLISISAMQAVCPVALEKYVSPPFCRIPVCVSYWCGAAYQFLSNGQHKNRFKNMATIYPEAAYAMTTHMMIL